MQFSITGSPGSNHHEIGKRLTERLGLNFYSAFNVAQAYCAEKGVPYSLFNHKNPDVDEYVTRKVLQLMELDDYVLDCLLLKKNTHGLKICIHNDIVSSSANAEAWYNSRQEEIVFTGDSDLFGYSPSEYDITVNKLHISDNKVIDIVVDSIVDGVFKANYVHPYQVLPLIPEKLEDNLPGYRNPKIVFKCVRYGFVYFLTDVEQYQQYLKYLVDGHMMRVELVEEPISELKGFGDYDWLPYFVPEWNLHILETSYLLARYCLKNGASDYEQVFVDMSRNTDPYRRLKDQP